MFIAIALVCGFELGQPGAVRGCMPHMLPIAFVDKEACMSTHVEAERKFLAAKAANQIPPTLYIEYSECVDTGSSL